ncbi:YoaK family protein [Streptomyces sp. RFCAC02]|uniref:YoaK family protein n=1 Tax=Streptomyces sp. RFCAC02 TaxID=2499143 RepID=UPI0010229BEA|nr:YoaK family protein [Streptomyces sp. RFCAC02]
MSAAPAPPAAPLPAAYPGALLVLTAAAGMVDAVSYLALDRVFTGNMTGNVLLLGFALAGADGLPVLHPLVAFAAFAAGAALTGRLVRRTGGVPRLPRVALFVLAGELCLAVLLAALWPGAGPGEPAATVLTAVLALMMGAQTAAVRPLGLTDLSTVVITSTLVSLVTGAGPGDRATVLRRAGALAAMTGGALLGALATTRADPRAALALTAVLITGALLLLLRARAADRARGRAPGALPGTRH